MDLYSKKVNEKADTNYIVLRNHYVLESKKRLGRISPIPY